MPARGPNDISEHYDQIHMFHSFLWEAAADRTFCIQQA